MAEPQRKLEDLGDEIVPGVRLIADPWMEPGTAVLYAPAGASDEEFDAAKRIVKVRGLPVTDPRSDRPSA